MWSPCKARLALSRGLDKRPPELQCVPRYRFKQETLQKHSTILYAFLPAKKALEKNSAGQMEVAHSTPKAGINQVVQRCVQYKTCPKQSH